MRDSEEFMKEIDDLLGVKDSDLPKFEPMDHDEWNKHITYHDIRLDNHEVNMILALFRNTDWRKIYNIVEEHKLPLSQEYHGKIMQNDVLSIFEDLEEKFTQLYYETPLHKKRCEEAAEGHCPECGKELKYSE